MTYATPPRQSSTVGPAQIFCESSSFAEVVDLPGVGREPLPARGSGYVEFTGYGEEQGKGSVGRGVLP